MEQHQAGCINLRWGGAGKHKVRKQSVHGGGEHGIGKLRPTGAQGMYVAHGGLRQGGMR